EARQARRELVDRLPLGRAPGGEHELVIGQRAGELLELRRRPARVGEPGPGAVEHHGQVRERERADRVEVAALEHEARGVIEPRAEVERATGRLLERRHEASGCGSSGVVSISSRIFAASATASDGGSTVGWMLLRGLDTTAPS